MIFIFFFKRGRGNRKSQILRALNILKRFNMLKSSLTFNTIFINDENRFELFELVNIIIFKNCTGIWYTGSRLSV